MKPTWRIECGDCLELLRALPDGCVDAVVTDPPYGLNYPYASYDDTPERLMAIVPEFIEHARRVATRVVVFPGVHNVQRYPKADWILSWSWRSTSHFGHAGYSMWQPILLYGKDFPDFGNVNGLTKTDSVHFPDGNGTGFLSTTRDIQHPCPKPLKVMKWLVQRFAREKEMVLDPFAGSGTTGVACIQTGRNFIGFEIDPGYCEIARRRCREAEDATALFDGPREPVEVQPSMFGDADAPP